MEWKFVKPFSCIFGVVVQIVSVFSNAYKSRLLIQICLNFWRSIFSKLQHIGRDIYVIYIIYFSSLSEVVWNQEPKFLVCVLNFCLLQFDLLIDKSIIRWIHYFFFCKFTFVQSKHKKIICRLRLDAKTAKTYDVCFINNWFYLPYFCCNNRWSGIIWLLYSSEYAVSKTLDYILFYLNLYYTDCWKYVICMMKF